MKLVRVLVRVGTMRLVEFWILTYTEIGPWWYTAWNWNISIKIAWLLASFGLTYGVEGEDDFVAGLGGDDVGAGAADRALVADEVLGREIWE